MNETSACDPEEWFRNQEVRNKSRHSMPFTAHRTEFRNVLKRSLFSQPYRLEPKAPDNAFFVLFDDTLVS